MIPFLPLLLSLPFWAPGDAAPPSRRDCAALARAYLAADEEERAGMRRDFADRLRPLNAREADDLGRALLRAARRVGPRLGGPGEHFFYDGKRGRYLVEGKPSRTLFVGLHGGGVGVGDASSMAALMGGGGFFWIFPEVLEKTERGWTDAGTERFVLELVEAAKRTGKVDPNRIYVTGHSMGGYGAWTLLAHHPDVFAGGAAYAGAPTPIWRDPQGGETLENIVGIVEGVLPNLLNSRLFVFQSADDPRVPPGPNRFAVQELEKWKRRFPEGFDFRYVEVEDRGHAPPREGYLPTQKWVAKHRRTARPRRLLWQPVLSWKHQFHWLYWERPTPRATLLVEARDGNGVAVTRLAGDPDISTLTLLLGPPIVDPDREVFVEVDGKEVYRGPVERRFETLLLTLPRRDEELLFAAALPLSGVLRGD